MQHGGFNVVVVPTRQNFRCQPSWIAQLLSKALTFTRRFCGSARVQPRIAGTRLTVVMPTARGVGLGSIV